MRDGGNSTARTLLSQDQRILHQSLIPTSAWKSSSLKENKSLKSESDEVQNESGSRNRASNQDEESESYSIASRVENIAGDGEDDEDQEFLDTSDEDYDIESDLESADDRANTEQISSSNKIVTKVIEEPFKFVKVQEQQQPAPAVQSYAKALRALENEICTRLTISDDQSAGSKIEERKLLALRDPVDKAGKPLHKPIVESTRLPIPGGNHALQDYQMQLMLLEQENKKRVMMARQEQDNFQAANMEAGASALSEMASTTGKSNVVDVQMVGTNFQHALDGMDASQLDMQKLQEYIELLQTKAQELGATQKEQVPSRYQVLYRIWQKEVVRDRKGRNTSGRWYSLPFFDHPEWVRGQGNASRVQCNLPLDNFELYLEKNKDIAFIVYRNFDPDLASIVAKPGPEDARAAHLPQHTSETIRPVNQDFIEVVKTLLSSQPGYAELLSEYTKSYELPAPYLFIYHNRNSLEAFQHGLPVPARTQLSLLWNYVTEQYADEYAAADSLLSQNKISPQFVPYLFKPGDVLVSRADGQHTGYVATSWPHISWKKRMSRMQAAASQNGTTLPFYGTQDAAASMAIDKITVYGCQINAWQWDFHGHFQRNYQNIWLEIPAVEDEGKNATNVEGKNCVKTEGKEHKPDLGGKNISELNVFPMHYASAEIIDSLRRRGKTFWNCRNRSYVSYQHNDMESIQNSVDGRYMVDYKTYRSLHPDNAYSGNDLKDELGPEAMARDEPPDEQFELLLPLKIKGYNLRRKKWFDLFADRISDVKWNKEAFQNLVIDRKARDLIQALVSNQLAAEKGTDLIMGKGNGLILLLHGGPGTGKTLTAESVAEIAEKPLYRVTCGDVGTKAEDVEKYLESVLHLGKIWGCVVLLDEADVFLEQRSLEDMERNALVSVFLRVLEYYEGILVLTSNRVGTFDEAFKSRIQLALHYPVLGPYQRLRIWENFISRLESFRDDTKVDIADLRDHLEDLKEEKMNGRQIRNAITTARQYAEWKGRTLTYEHLRDVIEVSGRFDKYLDRLNGGFTQDQLAEDEGLRLA